MVWLDIEYMRQWPWSHDGMNNRAVVEGAMAAYRSAGMRIGFYSTQRQWNDILGGARYGAPEWHTAGSSSFTAALRACSSRSFQGGPHARRAVVGRGVRPRRAVPGPGPVRLRHPMVHPPLMAADSTRRRRLGPVLAAVAAALVAAGTMVVAAWCA